MRCIKCGHKNTVVKDTRSSENTEMFLIQIGSSISNAKNFRMRVRLCRKCGKTFRTIELSVQDFKS